MNAKTFSKVILMAVIAASVSACATTGPTVASLGPGSDAAYLNATRGRRDAQMSSNQAQQYTRQRQQVAQEMELEQMKKRQFFENASGTINLARGIAGFF